MAFDLKSGNSAPFKMMGSSPVKQRIDPLDLGLIDEAKKVKVSTMPKNFNMTKSKDSWLKQSKKILKKGGKFFGCKLLGVIGMLGAKSAQADQPGTGTHGGTKTGTYNPKTRKYE